MLDILLRHGKNNPVLVGDAGVGKTAIAEALAQRLASGDVPVALRHMRLLSLDHLALLAGTQFRGQYEERVHGVVSETTAAGNVILFIDELHNLMGQGVALGAAMDAANMLKPALVRGEFRVVGATTGAEFDRWIRGDSALERRFQRVDVNEPDSAATLSMLRVRQQSLERHHNVIIHESALVASVKLTDLFMPERRRPDRALDALDEACAHIQGSARLSEAAERLALKRQVLLRNPGVRQNGPDHDGVAGSNTGSFTREDPPTVGLGPDLQIELPEIAREGMAALERFGAELESLFDGQWRGTWQGGDAGSQGADMNDVAGGGTRGAGGLSSSAGGEGATGASSSTAGGEGASGTSSSAEGAERRAGSTDDTDSSPRARTLAQVEMELRERLLQEGIVVRGHDVARVMSQITGKQISWVD